MDRCEFVDGLTPLDRLAQIRAHVEREARRFRQLIEFERGLRLDFAIEADSVPAHELARRVP